MKAQELITLAISAPILFAIFKAIVGIEIEPKKVPVRVRKNQPKK